MVFIRFTPGLYFFKKLLGSLFFSQNVARDTDVDSLKAGGGRTQNANSTNRFAIFSSCDLDLCGFVGVGEGYIHCTSSLSWILE